MVARENVDVLRKNGFEINVVGGDDGESEERERVYLTAQPISKSTVFDMKGEPCFLCRPFPWIGN